MELQISDVSNHNLVLVCLVSGVCMLSKTSIGTAMSFILIIIISNLNLSFI